MGGGQGGRRGKNFSVASWCGASWRGVSEGGGVHGQLGHTPQAAPPRPPRPPGPPRAGSAFVFVCSSSRLPDKARHWTRLFL